MTLDELRQRIKDEVVLHEGNVADYQWRQMGLTDEAARIGVSGPDFGRLVNQVSLTVAPDLSRIAEIKADILDLARQRRKRLTDADVRQLVDDAERAHLSRSFVVDTWIPTLLRQVPDEAEPSVQSSAPEPSPQPVPTAATGAVPVAQPVAGSAAEPLTAPGETADSVRRKVTEVLSDYDGHIPAPAIRSLFRTINYNEADLSVAIWNYLQIHQYVPDRDVPGGSLRDRLTATDWRYPVKTPPPKPTPPPIDQPGAFPTGGSFPSGPTLPPSPPPVVRQFTATPARIWKGDTVTLAWEVDNLLAVTIDDLGEGLSPRNRGWVKPTETTDYTLFDANNNPLSTVRVEVLRRDRSGLYGVLFALALLGLIYWFIRSGNSTPASPPKSERERPPERTTRTRRTTAISRPSRREPVEDVATDPFPNPPAPSRRNRVAERTPAPEAKPEANAGKSTADKPTASVPATRAPVRTVPPPPEPAERPQTAADARVGRYEEAFGDKPYDKVELGADERGWRRARSGGRWGYVNEADEWVIEPTFEAVTPFRGNTAAVFLDGKVLTINRAGEIIRN